MSWLGVVLLVFAVMFSLSGCSTILNNNTADKARELTYDWTSVLRGLEQVPQSAGNLLRETGEAASKGANALGEIKSSTKKKKIGIVLANRTETEAEVLIKFPDRKDRRLTVPAGSYIAPDELTYGINRGTNRFVAKTLWSVSGDFEISSYDRRFSYRDLNDVSAIPFILSGEPGNLSVQSGTR